MLTARQPTHYGYKSVHDLPTPPSTSRLSPPPAYQEPPRKRLSSVSRCPSPQEQHMSAPHRGLPPPAVMALPPQQSHSGGAPPPPPPPPPGPPSAGHQPPPPVQSQTSSQLPGPPPQWQGSEDSMKSWLAAKTEEERRKQEEEKTKQETLRLEQRRIEAEMLRASLHGGIPPPVVPLVFAGMGGAVSPAALDVAQQYLASGPQGQQVHLLPPQGQRSPEHRRDSQSHGYGQFGQPPTTPGTHGLITYPGSPTTRGRAQTLSSTGSAGRPLGPGSSLSSLNTSIPQPGQPATLQSQSAQAVPQQQPQSATPQQQESQQSPGIYFHHWQPPASLAGGSGSSNQPATPSGASNKSKRKRESL